MAPVSWEVRQQMRTSRQQVSNPYYAIPEYYTIPYHYTTEDPNAIHLSRLPVYLAFHLEIGVQLTKLVWHGCCLLLFYILTTLKVKQHGDIIVLPDREIRP